MNGIDENSWNPETDPALEEKISLAEPEYGKKANKIALLKEMRLPNEEDSPVFGVVSRLYHQKGLDLLADSFPELISNSPSSKYLVLGSGDLEEEKKFQSLANQFPQNISVFIGFDDGLARRIFAGADFFLMPSRFEPCGLAQQYAMKYGSIPIARRTGGLADTIIDFMENQICSNGFLFEKASSSELTEVIHRAINLFRTPDTFQKVRQTGLDAQCSWEFAANQYTEVYNWALDGK